MKFTLSIEVACTADPKPAPRPSEPARPRLLRPTGIDWYKPLKLFLFWINQG